MTTLLNHDIDSDNPRLALSGLMQAIIKAQHGFETSATAEQGIEHLTELRHLYARWRMTVPHIDALLDEKRALLKEGAD